ncbi:unnamed protein product, partial [Discosporangium mesarthrocarpum]
FQVGELRKHQLLEAHVRCYALKHEKLRTSGDKSCETPDSVFFQCHNMRLQHPDDELGAPLLLVVPQTVVHRIDTWSPMMPPPRWNSSTGATIQWGLHLDKDIVKAPWVEDSPPPTPLPAQPVESPTMDPTEEETPLRFMQTHKRSLTAHDHPVLGMLVRAGRGGRGERAFKKGFACWAEEKSQEEAKASEASRVVLRRDSDYWEHEFTKDSLGKIKRDQEHGPGYVYRFPDLLKRWDDVDGDRGTW